MKKANLFSLFFLLFGISLAGLPQQEGWAASDATKPTCTVCHGNFKSVLPSSHPPVAGKNIASCLACHKPTNPEKAAPNPFSARLHRAHVGAKTKVDCLICHTWTPGKSFSLAGQKGSWGPLSKEEMALLKKTTDSWSDSTYMDALHASKNVTCTGCHAKRLPLKDETVENDRCLSCHDSYEKLAAKTASAEFPMRNPHQSHLLGLDCTKCHMGHQESKSYCLKCHPTFSQKIPGGAAGTSKAPEKKVPASAPAAAPKIEGGASQPGAPAAPGSPATALNCGTCHSEPKYQQHFAQTSHGALTCTTCHLGIQNFTRHMQKKEKSKLISCAVCHRNIEKQYEKSYHALVAKISCLQCHTDIHPPKALPAKKRNVASVQTCLRCHSDENKYLNKGHTAKALAGNADAAVCSNCHGIHGIPVFAATDKGIADKRIYYTQLCISCHREGRVAGKYGVFPMVVSTYGETYHGKVMKLGYPGQVAGCADCHAAHNILPAGDPASAMNPDQLVKTCGTCHRGFHPRFVSYMPHPVPDDPHRFLGLYLTKKFMIALLTGVFGFFWIHIALWWRKSYAEKSRLLKKGIEYSTELPEEEGRQYVMRFGVQERVMHVVLILSFFGLVLSGFPLKYPDAWGSKVLVSLFGGVENAGAIHRISAVAMWLLFLYTWWLSLKFLFPAFKCKGWVGRLFGPDSLFPRIKDFWDCWGMFKWFFNVGKRPVFDRWTYWEKFDFMAVFWGMFVIGFSGIVMWIPELSSYIMPGWMINIVHLAHSEEAFLAAVFIFTIHFFNNHLVPDKFPLERNIFTGSYTVEALKRERPLEYERILEENRLEEIKCKGPSIGIQFFAGLFGIASVLLGLALTAVIFWATLMT